MEKEIFKEQEKLTRMKAEAINYRNRYITQKLKVNNLIKKNNRRQIIILDIIFVIAILMNMGALFMTHLLVIQTSEDITFYEMNTLQCEWNGFMCASDNKEFMIKMIIPMLIITLMVGIYIYLRTLLTTEWMITILTLFVTYCFIMMGYDFINNLGYYMGMIIYK